MVKVELDSEVPDSKLRALQTLVLLRLAFNLTSCHPDFIWEESIED